MPRIFSGFSSGIEVVPTQFFEELLPEIEDPAELRVTIFVFHLLNQFEGDQRFLFREDFTEQQQFMKSLSEDPDEAEETIEKGAKPDGLLADSEVPDFTRSETGQDPFAALMGAAELPATGFSPRHTAALPEQPGDLNYQPLRMHLQIPSLGMETELVTVPLVQDVWQVKWLGNRAGVLDGTAMPGEGYSVVAAHNTLSGTEYGPFALLNTLEVNDAVMVSGSNGKMKLFRVYASELLDPDDAEKLVSAAEREANSLVLLTCENETAEGGYLNRRAVFAKFISEQ